MAGPSKKIRVSDKEVFYELLQESEYSDTSESEYSSHSEINVNISSVVNKVSVLMKKKMCQRQQ
jgi:predicted transcriptional regulator